MLEFFRKYQRYFFIVITVMVIASFSFFGTFNTFMDEEKRDDRIAGRAIDGSPIRLLQVQQIARFLSTDREDLPEKGVPSNLLNDGVVRYDFLRAGLAEVLVAAYFKDFNPGLQTRLDKAKRFRPYAHPEMPALSAKAVWERYLPLLNQEISTLQKESIASVEVFSRLSRIYQQQSFLQPELLRRILMYHHQQYPWLSIDPKLTQDDLAVFGFHSLSEWFGDDFLHLVSQFILNAAVAAEEKGYRVSLDEAKGDLIHNFETSLSKLAAAQIKPDLNYRQHLRMLGFDEATAAEVWQKVLLFRRYFQDVGQAAFLDRAPYQGFANFAQETATLEKYEWPDALRFKNVTDLAEFQFYLNAVCKQEKNILALPQNFLPIEEVEKKAPELVQAGYKARVAQLTKSQIGLRSSLKEIWEWQTNEKNWELLRKEFSFLPKTSSSSERFDALEKLDVPSRSQIDAFSRNQWVDQNPEWIQQALDHAQTAETHLALFGPDQAPSLRMPNVENGERLAALIAKAAGQDSDAIAALRLYSDDGSTFFRFEGVEKVSDKHILTFEEAKSLLPKMTEKYLEGQYLKVRAQSPAKFQTSEGQWKSFVQVREEATSLILSDVLTALEKVRKNESADSKKPSALRLMVSAQQALEDLKKDPMDPRWIKTEGDPLVQQFKLVCNECHIQRNAKENWMSEDDFVMMPNQWSPIRLSDEGQVVFFYLKEKKTTDTPILDLLSFGKETLAADAQRYLAEKLLESAKNKKAIVIPLQTADQLGDQNEPL